MLSEQNKKWIHSLAFTVLALTGSVLTCLAIYEVNYSFVEKFRAALLAAAVVGWCALYAASVVCAVKNWKKTVKLFYTGYGLAIFLLVCVIVMARLGFFELVQSVEDLRKLIEEAGSFAWIAFIVLQFLQVVLLPIPGMVSTAAGLAMFGPVKSFIYSLIGIEVGSLVAFAIGRKLGYKAVVWLVGKEDLDEWMKKFKRKDSLLLTAMFLFPLFPDDLLCFVAGLSSMSFPYFLGMTLVTRSVSVAVTCFSFGFIPFNTWWGLLIWAVLFAIVIAVFFLVYRNLDTILEKIHKKKK